MRSPRLKASRTAVVDSSMHKGLKLSLQVAVGKFLPIAIANRWWPLVMHSTTIGQL